MSDNNSLLGRTSAALDERYEEILPVDDDWLDQLASAALEHLAAEITALIEQSPERPPTAEDLARLFLHASQGVAAFPPPWRPGGGRAAA
jgi:hypothetical protein